MPLRDDRLAMEVSGLKVAYKSGGQRRYVLDKLGFSLSKGEIVALLGESGSGKSTLAKAVTGLLPPALATASGTLVLGTSEPVSLGNADGWGRIRGRRIGMLFQDARLALNPLVTIKAHFQECLSYHGIASLKAAVGIGAELLGYLGFEQPHDVLARYPFELSGGMCQRVCLALALSLKPDVLIADEPTSALDTVSQQEVLDLLRRLRGELALSVLLITHDIAVAHAASDRIIVLDKGVIVEEGASASVLAKPQAALTRELLAARRRPAYLPGSSGKAVAEPWPGAGTRTEACIGAGAGTEACTVAEAGAGGGGCATAGVGAPLLVASAVSQSLGGPVPVLHNASLTLHEGEILGILGRSGSGKSTLVRCMAGLDQPDAGSILFRGEDTALLRGRRKREHARHIQLIFQDARASLNPGRTALQLVQEPLHYLRIGRRREREELARRYLQEVGITDGLQHRKPPELSTGQCQRVAIARALVLGPEVLLCDEAVSALDMRVQAQILELLLRLHQQFGFAIVMISHDIRVLRTFCHTIAVLNEGRISEVRPAGDIHASPSPHTRLLLQCAGEMEAGLAL